MPTGHLSDFLNQEVGNRNDVLGFCRSDNFAKHMPALVALLDPPQPQRLFSFGRSAAHIICVGQLPLTGKWNVLHD
ncbi:hypothetical protein CH75_23955 [Dyella jiangningensis]|nr:hypothetical protein CH75_00875 [Dyella jiangningensis]AHX16491.1 hypothetical protein CH75_23955 [Dyella jiangningensis]